MEHPLPALRKQPKNILIHPLATRLRVWYTIGALGDKGSFKADNKDKKEREDNEYNP